MDELSGDQVPEAGTVEQAKSGIPLTEDEMQQVKKLMADLEDTISRSSRLVFTDSPMGRAEVIRSPLIHLGDCEDG